MEERSHIAWCVNLHYILTVCVCRCTVVSEADLAPLYMEGRRVGAKAFTKKVPYLDTEDTLEEVGITRRQLNYWKEKELFTPEFGGDSKKFTERDVKLLKFARRLIVDQGFPVEVAKRLIDAASSSNLWWEEADLDDFQYLDIKSGTLLTKASLEYSLWLEFGATADQNNIEDRVYTLALLLFRSIRLTDADGASFKARRDKILKQIRDLSFAARVEWGHRPGESEPCFHVDPLLPGESPPDADVAESWLASQLWRLDGFKHAANEARIHRRQMRRFWDDETEVEVLEWQARQTKKEIGEANAQESTDISFEDVPL